MHWITFPISCLPLLLKISQFQQCRRLEQLETMLIQQSARIQTTNAFVPFVVSALCWNETLIQFLFLALRFRCTSLFYSPVKQRQKHITAIWPGGCHVSCGLLMSRLFVPHSFSSSSPSCGSQSILLKWETAQYVTIIQAATSFLHPLQLHFLPLGRRRVLSNTIEFIIQCMHLSYSYVNK